MPLEILDTAKSNPATLSSLAAVASAVFALLGVIVTSFISWSVSRRQIRASLISANRQAWINALRDDLSELWELLDWLYRLRPGTYDGQDGYKHVDWPVRLSGTENRHKATQKSYAEVEVLSGLRSGVAPI
jgi:hypothetical protein